MALHTRLTERLGIEHPIVSAPMGTAAGGRLAAAVTAAGGLGLIGGGYGDADWLEREFNEAANARVGCGFITWSLAQQPHLLPQVLRHAPAAIMLSFGSPLPFAPAVKAAGTPLICQVQTMAHAREAIAADADIIVAQGAEAGGHGVSRATLTLVPEIADYLAHSAPATLLLAAGGIADGRGLAAALMLGADGVLVGSRFWASEEALVPKSFQAAAVAATGDDTIRTTVVDVARKIDWPQPFTARVLQTRFTTRWHGARVRSANRARWRARWSATSRQPGAAMSTIPASSSARPRPSYGISDPRARSCSKWSARRRSCSPAKRHPSCTHRSDQIRSDRTLCGQRRPCRCSLSAAWTGPSRFTWSRTQEFRRAARPGGVRKQRAFPSRVQKDPFRMLAR
jgi:nitronate monooxygenase